MALRPTVLSLFTGAGGLDLGLEAAGFETKLCVEVDEDARATLQRNRPRWQLATPGDIHQHQPEWLLSLADLQEREVDLLAAGPPCQPFSKSGYWSQGDSRRLADPRANTLAACIRVTESALPRVLLLENVRGLTFRGKNEGLQLVREGLQRINECKKTNYRLSEIHINAAHYGVPQFRERVFLIAARSGALFQTPPRTHGESSDLQPFRTAWDAIGDLDSEKSASELAVGGKWARILGSIPEGGNYLWHTPEGGGEPIFGWRTRYWSFLLKLAKARPSWTIQAEPGPATGPFHWKNRLLSVRELCRLQTIPDTYSIQGNRRSAQRQIGNAVPSALAELLGLEIRRQLFETRGVRTSLRYIPEQRANCPRPERRRRVPKEYLELRAPHDPHPGTGLGPGAHRQRAFGRAG